MCGYGAGSLIWASYLFNTILLQLAVASGVFLERARSFSYGLHYIGTKVNSAYMSLDYTLVNIGVFSSAL